MHPKSPAAPTTRPKEGGTKDQHNVLVQINEEGTTKYYVCRMKKDKSGAEAAHYALLAQEKALAMRGAPAEALSSSPSPFLIDYMPRCFNKPDKLVLLPPPTDIPTDIPTDTPQYTKNAFQGPCHVFLQDINFTEPLTQEDLRKLNITPPAKCKLIVLPM